MKKFTAESSDTFTPTHGNNLVHEAASSDDFTCLKPPDICMFILIPCITLMSDYLYNVTLDIHVLGNSWLSYLSQNLRGT